MLRLVATLAIALHSAAYAQTEIDKAAQGAAFNLVLGRECEALHSDPAYFEAAMAKAQTLFLTGNVPEETSNSILAEMEDYEPSLQDNEFMISLCHSLLE